jgi:hypothetical protein
MGKKKYTKCPNCGDPKGFDFAGYKLNSDDSGLQVERQHIAPSKGKDYGADPLGDGTFRMVPSGDIVDYDERVRRLAYLQRR